MYNQTLSDITKVLARSLITVPLTNWDRQPRTFKIYNQFNRMWQETALKCPIFKEQLWFFCWKILILVFCFSVWLPPNSRIDVLSVYFCFSFISSTASPRRWWHQIKQNQKRPRIIRRIKMWPDQNGAWIPTVAVFCLYRFIHQYNKIMDHV